MRGPALSKGSILAGLVANYNPTILAKTKKPALLLDIKKIMLKGSSSFISIALMRYTENSREERVILVQDSRLHFLVGGKSKWQEVKQLIIYSQSRTERDKPQWGAPVRSEAVSPAPRLSQRVS